MINELDCYQELMWMKMNKVCQSVCNCGCLCECVSSLYYCCHYYCDYYQSKKSTQIDSIPQIEK